MDLSVPIVAEMEQYKSALRACYAKYDASPLAFEVGRHSGKGGHAHIQVGPFLFLLLFLCELGVDVCFLN